VWQGRAKPPGAGDRRCPAEQPRPESPARQTASGSRSRPGSRAGPARFKAKLRSLRSRPSGKQRSRGCRCGTERFPGDTGTGAARGGCPVTRFSISCPSWGLLGSHRGSARGSKGGFIRPAARNATQARGPWRSLRVNSALWR